MSAQPHRAADHPHRTASIRAERRTGRFAVTSDHTVARGVDFRQQDLTTPHPHSAATHNDVTATGVEMLTSGDVSL